MAVIFLDNNDKKELQDQIDTLKKTDEIPDYWQDTLDEGVEAINIALCTAGANKSAFLFYSDVHWNYGSQMSPTLLKYLYRHTGMTKTFFGGDIVSDEATDYDTMSYLWDWRNQLKDLPNHHSVVGNHDNGNSTNNLFSEQYVYGYLLSAEEAPDIVRGNSGMYYYIDHSPEKTRYLFLDTAYKSANSNQQEFVKEALITTPNGWHIVAIAHIWYDANYDTNPPTVSGLNSGASSLLTMFDNYNSRSGDYADCGGWVEFCIGGHTHIDYDGTSTAGIPIILVETDSKNVRSGLEFTEGTTTEASVNGIIADYDNHKIHVIRIGRGESREVQITNYVVNYTNVLSTATDIDGNIYNIVGYMSDREISTSSYAERDASGGWDLTGYIKVCYGDVIRLKNIVMPDGVTDRNNMCYLYNANKSWVGNSNITTTAESDFSPIFENGNLVQFTIKFFNGESNGYIRLNATQIDTTSVITINEPIE